MKNESESQEHGKETSNAATLGDSLLWCSLLPSS